MSISFFITVVFTSVAIGLQLFSVKRISDRLISVVKNPLMSIFAAYLISEIILLLFGYLFIAFSGGHIFPKISIIQAGLYYILGISIWNEPVYIL